MPEPQEIPVIARPLVPHAEQAPVGTLVGEIDVNIPVQHIDVSVLAIVGILVSVLTALAFLVEFILAFRILSGRFVAYLLPLFTVVPSVSPLVIPAVPVIAAAIIAVIPIVPIVPVFCGRRALSRFAAPLGIGAPGGVQILFLAFQLVFQIVSVLFHILLSASRKNSLSALEKIRPSSSSSFSFLKAARFLTTCATFPGSFGKTPRKGTGVR